MQAVREVELSGSCPQLRADDMILQTALLYQRTHVRELRRGGHAAEAILLSNDRGLAVRAQVRCAKLRALLHRTMRRKMHHSLCSAIPCHTLQLICGSHLTSSHLFRIVPVGVGGIGRPCRPTVCAASPPESSRSSPSSWPRQVQLLLLGGGGGCMPQNAAVQVACSQAVCIDSFLPLSHCPLCP